MMHRSDPHNLQRFLSAQAGNYQGHPTYNAAQKEIHAGSKRSHYIWYIFPMLHGLGRSQANATFSIKSVEEAKAYLRHPILGPRLIDLTRTMLAHAHRGKSLDSIVKDDAWKFKQCMTLFAVAAYANGNTEAASLFTNTLKSFNCRPARHTLQLASMDPYRDLVRAVFPSDQAPRPSHPRAEVLLPAPQRAPVLGSYRFSRLARFWQHAYRIFNPSFSVDNAKGVGKIMRHLMGINEYERFRQTQHGQATHSRPNTTLPPQGFSQHNPSHEGPHHHVKNRPSTANHTSSKKRKNRY